MREPVTTGEAGDVNLPAGWLSVRADLAGSVRLGRQRSPDQLSGDYPTKYVRAANITPSGIDLEDLLEMNFTPSEREVFSLRAGDVLLTEASGSSSQVGRAAIWRGELDLCCYQNTVIRFRPHLTTSEFALIVFRYFAASGTFARVAHGVGIQHLGASRFAALLVPLPPMAEQVRIVEAIDKRLGQIREADERLNSALRHLNEQVHEILAAAVHGELVPRTVAGEPGGNRRQRPSDQMTLFEEISSADTPDVPAGWRTILVEQAGEVTLGRQRSPQHERGRHMRPYLRVANVYEDRIDTSDVLEMNFEPGEVATYELRPGDILLNEGQSPELVGRAAVYRGEVPGACFQNTLIRFRAAEDLEPEYALLVFRHYLHAGIFRQIARWSTNIAHLGLERFKALPFPIPPIEEQRRIVTAARERLHVTSQQQSAIQSSLAQLPVLQHELLTAAVSGDLVPQDPEEEPAVALVSRLGPPSKDAVCTTSKRPRRMPNQRSRTTALAEPAPDLAAVLRENGGVLPLPQLFSQAGYDRDKPEHVEFFYLALREAIDKTIQIRGGVAENADIGIVDAA